MGSIFGVAKKGFGMLKKAKKTLPTESRYQTFLKRRKELGGIDWETFKKQHKAPPGVPGTDKAKQKIASDFVKIRKRTKSAWQKKKLHPMEKAKGGAVKKPRPGYGPTLPSVTTDVHERRKKLKSLKPEYPSVTTDVHERRKKREAWLKSLKPEYPTKPKSPWDAAKPRAGRPGARKKRGPQDRHPPKTKRMGRAAGRPPKKRPRPMSTS